jgi:RecA-family ATPase
VSESEIRLPRARDAEEYVIGVLVVYHYDHAVMEEVFRLLTATDFFDPEHQKIFAIAQQQHAAGGIDVVLLGNKAGAAQTLVKFGMDENYKPTTSAHVASQAAAIIEARRKRDLWEHHSTLADHSLNGWTSSQLLRADEAFRYEIKRSIEATATRDTFTARDLAKRFPALKPVLIDGIARIGEIINCIAPTKTGKSWFVSYVVFCVLVGLYVFGRFRATKGRVLIVDNELHPETIVSRLQYMANAMGIAWEDVCDLLVIKTLRGNLRSFAEVAAEIREQFEPGEFVLIVFDAKYRFAQLGQSENDNAAEAMFYNAADRFATDMQAAIAFVHHSTKGSQSEKRASDVGAGGGSQSRAADVHAIFREHEEEDTFVFEALVRSFPPIQPIALRWQFPLFVPADDVDPTQLIKLARTFSRFNQAMRNSQRSRRLPGRPA